MIEGHGDDAYRYGGRVCHNLSSNICGDVDHSALMAYLAGRGASIASYPQPEADGLRDRIASLLGVQSGEVLVTNGATEAIYLAAHAFAGCTSAIVSPTFREYEDACALYGHTVTHIQSLEELKPSDGMVWMCNPNNPTGCVTDKTALLRVISSHPDVTFMVDQAYADYTTCELLTASEAVEAGNVILLSSLTKRFSIPGMRIGYAVGPGNLLERMRRMRMPWSVNALAIDAAHYLLDRTGESVIDADGLHAEALRVRSALISLGLEVSSTDCNFMLCRLPAGSSAQLKDWLVEEAGVLIRDASNFHGLTSSHFRIAVRPEPEVNDLFINSLKKWMSS